MLASLAELGIDRSDQEPTVLTEDLLDQADVVIAPESGLGITAPAGVDEQTWDLPNPATWDIDSIRPLRDHLLQCVRALIDQVVADYHAAK